jgi:type IV secretion system protein VirB6
MQVVQHLEQQLDTALLLYVSATSQAMTNYLVPIAVTGTTIYYTMMGYAMARGDVSEPMSKLTKDVFTMLLVATVALVGGNYQNFVIGGFNAILSDLVSLVTVHGNGAPPMTSVGQAIDFIFEGCITPPGESRCLSWDSVLWFLAWKYRVAGFIPDLSWLWASILAGLAEDAIIVCCMLPYLLSKMALAVFLAIGPPFVLCLMWPSTRKYFDGWFSATLGNVMTLVIIAAICSVVPTIFRQYVVDAFNGITAEGVDVVARIDMLLVVALGMGFVALHASQKGAALAGGGVAMDSKGIGGMITQALITKAAFAMGGGKGADAGGDKGNDKEKPPGGDGTDTNEIKPGPSMGYRAATGVGKAAGSAARHSARTLSNVLGALSKKNTKK